MSMALLTRRELGYFVLHVYHILGCWSYQLFILFAYRCLYHLVSSGTKAYLDHEYKIITHDRRTLFTRLRDLWFLFTRPNESLGNTVTNFSRLRAERSDTPSAAFCRIIHNIHLLPTSARLSVFLDSEIQHFWHRGINDTSKPDHFLFGGNWHTKDLPDPREKLGNDPLLCAIAASAAEQMAEVFNWRIGLGVRRDFRMLRARKPYWDKNLALCMAESAPDWCKHVGPVQVQTVVDREGTARGMLESKADISPSFRKRNLLASSQFMYFV